MRSSFLALLLLLAACGARQTTPVAMSQPGDEELSCDQIAAQISRNEAEAIRLIGEEEDVESGNVAAGVVAGALVAWPVLLAIDMSDAERIQYRALRDRNTNLGRLQQQQGC